jgi:hypothetical protein
MIKVVLDNAQSGGPTINLDRDGKQLFQIRLTATRPGDPPGYIDANYLDEDGDAVGLCEHPSQDGIVLTEIEEGSDMRGPFFTAAQHEDLNNWFTYHPPTQDQVERYQLLREAGKALAASILHCTSPGADQSAAIRKVREAVMTANAAIACGEWKDNIQDVEAVEGSPE